MWSMLNQEKLTIGIPSPNTEFDTEILINGNETITKKVMGGSRREELEKKIL